MERMEINKSSVKINYKSIILISCITLLCIFILSIICVSYDKNTEPENVEVIEPEMGYYITTSNKEKEYEINPNAARHPYNLDLFISDGLDISYEGDANFTTRKGVDVSKWQGDVDWKKVKAAGYEFAYFRLGYRGYQQGGLFVDSTLDQNMVNAGKEGFDIGVYFFSQAISEEEAIEEAYFVLNELNNYDVQLPVVYDPEFVYAHDSRTKDLSSEQIMKNIKAFCDVIENAGYETMVYASMYWEADILDMGELKDYSIWYADYMEKPQTPYDFKFWQYSDTGRVDGIDGNVDLNIQFIPSE